MYPSPPPLSDASEGEDDDYADVERHSKYDHFISKCDSKSDISKGLGKKIAECIYDHLPPNTAWISKGKKKKNETALKRAVRKCRSLILVMTPGIFHKDRYYVHVEVMEAIDNNIPIIGIAAGFNFEDKCIDPDHPIECCRNVKEKVQPYARAILELNIIKLKTKKDTVVEKLDDINKTNIDDINWEGLCQTIMDRSDENFEDLKRKLKTLKNKPCQHEKSRRRWRRQREHLGIYLLVAVITTVVVLTYHLLVYSNSLSKHLIRITKSKCEAGQVEGKEGKCIQCDNKTWSNHSTMECQPCEPGQHFVNHMEPCKACGAGKYANDSKCYECPKGFFQESRRQTKCKKCEAGQYSESVGVMNKCSLCDVGKVTGNQDGQYECKSCPKNTRASEKDTCIDCESGQYTLHEASTQCNPCAPGKYMNILTHSCKECPLGWVQPLWGKATCEVCPSGFAARYMGGMCHACESGKFQNERGSSHCNECETGMYSPRSIGKGIICRACPSGWVQTDSGKDFCHECTKGWYFQTIRDECTLCPVGYEGTAKGQCTVCRPGYVQPYPGRTSCNMCSAGKYAVTNRTNKTDGIIWPRQSCIDCRKGRFQPDDGQTECQLCPVGYRGGIKNQVTCERCEVGKFQPHEGEDSCILCEAGRFASLILRSNFDLLPMCFDCPQGWYQNLPGRKDCIQCDYGTFYSTPSKICDKCPSGYFGVNKGSLNCSECLQGQVQQRDGQKSCEHCEVGMYANSSKVPCQICPQGYVQPESGQRLCNACTKGKIDAGGENCETCALGSLQKRHISGVHFCSECAAGYFDNRSNEEGLCQECPVGYFQTKPGQTNCSICPQGYIDNFASRVACKPCSAGMFQPNEGQRQCNLCPKGKFQMHEAQSITCELCPLGWSQAFKGMTFCSECKRGKTFIDQTVPCKACAMGFFGYKNGHCAACARGQIQPNPRQIECIPCSRGTFNNYTQNIREMVPYECRLCDSNTYCGDCRHAKSLSPIEACHNCPMGFYQPEIGHYRCLACPAGFFSNEIKAGRCSKCSAGTMQREIAQTKCISCPSGTYSEDGELCKDCPQGHVQPHSGERSCTACRPGHYKERDMENCVPCPSGMYQIAYGRSECNSCKPGSFGKGTGNEICTPCQSGMHQLMHNQDHCEICRVGLWSDNNAITCKNMTCEKGTIAVNVTGGAKYPTHGCTSCGIVKNSSGYFGLGGSTRRCLRTACPSGKFAGKVDYAKNETDGCTPCNHGTYKTSDMEDSESCKRCPDYSSTVGQGAKSIHECKCILGYRDVFGEGVCSRVEWVQIRDGETEKEPGFSQGCNALNKQGGPIWSKTGMVAYDYQKRCQEFSFTRMECSGLGCGCGCGINNTIRIRHEDEDKPSCKYQRSVEGKCPVSDRSSLLGMLICTPYYRMRTCPTSAEDAQYGVCEGEATAIECIMERSE